MVGDEAIPAQSVVVVTDSLSDTGSIRWLNALAERWAAEGSEVVLFSLLDRRDIPLARVPTGVHVAHGGMVSDRLRRALPRCLPRLVRAAMHADVVMVLSEVGWSLPLAYCAARRCRRPFVVMVQSILDYSIRAWVPRRRRWLWRYCIRHADAVTSVSPGSAESVRRLGGSADRLTVISPGRDVDEVCRLSQATPARYADGARPLVLAIGELVPAKGFDLLVRAVAGVRARGLDIKLLILGDGAQRRDLEDLAAQLGIADAVQLAGFVADPYPEMLAADLICVSSRFEGFPLCLLEALALARPIVAADAAGGGPRVLLDGGRLGELVPPESADALEAAIIAHFRRPDVLRARAIGGPDQARRFSPAAAAETYRALFSRLGAVPSGDRRLKGVVS